MLTENEILYIKTILKQQNENWENKSTLADIYRHAKFTIRKLSRQMALIDDIQIFRKIREPNIENTLFMVYMAERLYSARGDSQKVFKNLAKFMYDSEKFEEVSKMS